MTITTEPKLRISYRDRQITKAKEAKNAPQKINPAFVQPYTDLAPKALRKVAFRKRERDTDEALPPASDLWRRSIYRTGDGEVLQQPRPGSLDFLKWPSRGNKT
jgi:hypothetical protein